MWRYCCPAPGRRPVTKQRFNEYFVNLLVVVTITILSLLPQTPLPSAPIIWLWTRFSSSGNCTGQAEQGFGCACRLAHSHQTCWPRKTNLPIFFKGVQNWCYFIPCKKVMKIINGPLFSPLFCHLKVSPESEYIHNLTPSLLQHAPIGPIEKDRALEFMAILPGSSGTLTWSQRKSALSRRQKESEAKKKKTQPASSTHFSGLVLAPFLLVSDCFWQFLKPVSSLDICIITCT